MSQNQITASLESVTFQPGDYLFREGEATAHFYILQTGSVEVYRKQANGEKLKLAQLGEGSSVGEFAYIDRRPRSASVIALTAVEAVLVSEKAYQELLNELPDWAVSLIGGLIDRLRTTNEQVRELKSLDQAKSAQIQAATEFSGGKAFDLTDVFKNFGPS